jgi:hypothetical protein
MAEGLAGLRIYGLAEALADEIWDEVITWKPFPQEFMARIEELAPHLNAYIRTLARNANRRGTED